jgi:hypothetical protein
MPFTINGVGTSVCDSRGHVNWGGGNDHDALECLVILFVPVMPIKAVHTFDWNGNQYRQIPIRWSGALVAYAFLRRWLLVSIVIGVILGFAGFADKTGASAALIVIGGLMVAGSSVGLWLIRQSDQRTRDIRRVMGPHDLGSSDPATWPESLLQGVKPAKDSFGTLYYAEAVAARLAVGDFSGAMWAARLSTALEGRHSGEELTKAVLEYPGVREAIEVVRQDPKRWAEVMRKPAG